VVEVGSNDGALLACFASRGIPALGVEPAANVARAALARGLATDISFFGESTARRLAAEGWSADLILATNVLGQAPDLNDFLAGVRLLLKPDGLFTVEFPHVLNLLREVQFDTIYHEHFSYFSLLALAALLARCDLVPVEVERRPVHGGSLRVLAARAGSRHAIGGSVAEVLSEERAADLDRPEGYLGFAARVEAVRDGFAAFMARARAEGRTVAGYGAAAKGNTFLNHVGAGPGDVAFVVDRNPAKQGRLLPGSRIPVRPVEALAEARPDYVLILPWNLREEVIGQLDWVRKWGGQFVTAVPQVEVMS
jgi:SAM-dependent methyltransferase